MMRNIYELLSAFSSLARAASLLVLLLCSAFVVTHDSPKFQ